MLTYKNLSIKVKLRISGFSQRKVNNETDSNTPLNKLTKKNY